MPTRISVIDSIATVSVDVSLEEWGGVFPDAEGVLTRASELCLKSIAASKATLVPALDAKIAALQAEKDSANDAKPIVTGV